MNKEWITLNRVPLVLSAVCAVVFVLIVSRGCDSIQSTPASLKSDAGLAQKPSTIYPVDAGQSECDRYLERCDPYYAFAFCGEDARTFQERLKTWTPECRLKSYDTNISCSSWIPDALYKAATTPKEKEIYSSFQKNCKEEARKRAARDAADKLALEKEARRKLDDAEAHRKLCSIRYIQNDCCEKACNGIESIGKCLAIYASFCDTIDASSTLTCGCN